MPSYEIRQSSHTMRNSLVGLAMHGLFYIETHRRCHRRHVKNKLMLIINLIII